MYALYAEDCKNANKEYASQITYRRIFGSNFNFKPKKDQCLVCANYMKTKSADLEENYQYHIRRKDEANKAKKSDKERSHLIYKAFYKYRLQMSHKCIIAESYVHTISQFTKQRLRKPIAMRGPKLMVREAVQK